MKKIWKIFSQIFFLDTKALAFMRIGLAIIILIDIFTQVPFISEIFTNQGIIPPLTVNAEFPRQNIRTIHTLNGELRYFSILVGIQIIITILWGLGSRTSTLGFFVWFLTFSFHNANPLSQYGFDELLQISLFWAMFLPMGQAISMDAKKKFGTYLGKPYRFSSLATIGLITHLIGLYTTAMALRWPGIQEAGNNTRLFNILHHTYMVKPLGEWVRQSLTYSQILLRVTIIVESFTWVLWLIPSRKDRVRNYSVVIFILWHFGLFLAMDVGLFPWACIFILVGLLSFHSPKQYWKKKENTISALLLFLIIYTTIWNLNLVKKTDEYKILPDSTYKFGYLFGLHHNRGLFQGSGEDYIRYIVTGKNEQGETIDVLANKKVIDYTYLEYPDSNYYDTHRHVKILQSIPRYPRVSNFVSYYYCLKYPEIQTMQIEEMKRKIPEGHLYPAQRKILNTYDCIELVEISPPA